MLHFGFPAKAQPAPSDFKSIRLRDRAIVVLAQRLLALSIRSNGNMAELLGQRLSDSRFPAGTVTFRLSGHFHPVRRRLAGTSSSRLVLAQRDHIEPVRKRSA